MKLLRTRPDAEINAAIQDAIRDALDNWSPMQFEGEFPKNGFGITNLKPWHLIYDASSRTMTGTYANASGLFWGFSFAASLTWYSIVNNITTSDRAYLVIEGVFSRMPDPALTQIQPIINSEETPVIDVEEFYTWDLAEAWLNKPFWLKPQSTLSIRAVADNAVTRESIGFLGHVIGKRPYLFSRTPTV